MSGLSLADELRQHQDREDDGQDTGGAEEEQASPAQGTRAGRGSIAHPENDADVDVEFNIHDQGSLQAYLANLVGEFFSEAPAQRDIHNLTLRFSSPGRATPARVLERLAGFMKLAGETLEAELGAVRAGRDGRSEDLSPQPQAHPAAAPPGRDSPVPVDLLTVFSRVPRT